MKICMSTQIDAHAPFRPIAAVLHRCEYFCVADVIPAPTGSLHMCYCCARFDKKKKVPVFPLLWVLGIIWFPANVQAHLCRLLMCLSGSDILQPPPPPPPAPQKKLLVLQSAFKLL